MCLNAKPDQQFWNYYSRSVFIASSYFKRYVSPVCFNKKADQHIWNYYLESVFKAKSFFLNICQLSVFHCKTWSADLELLCKVCI